MVQSSTSCLPIQSMNRSRKGNQDSPDYGELSSISSIQNKNSIVRVILASGMVDAYDTVVSAYSVMQKYPRLCLARPEVFRSPHNSIVGPKEMLFPGEKFYLVPRTTVRKLLDKSAVKNSEVEKIEVVKAVKDSKVETIEVVKTVKDLNVEKIEVVKEVKDLKMEKIEVVKALKESEERDEEGSGLCSAKDFYSSNDQWKKCGRMKKSRKGVKEEEKKTFRPIMKKDLCRWRPTLPPIDEVSP